ncbi:hypothetical protein QP027_10475 [Corynebacterium breve]|uniref:Terminal beta-(1->2)-arabinofuranosyltransferase C-terminal domain-containing protein n=1 Tax=Corynebacterium breve TaxID=3049799 RepID=A0ABY8VCW5_9CORY|nr:hypothetical protein [Corynebacterium breve]WIM67511.1 hypothetical protein QP027_10475 [Corynebacterium breve]
MTKDTRISLIISATIAGVFAFYGGWQRRWISDDGLIVLRTVRNIMAGNGPVFNAGERVEANTSTLWQYLITAVAWITRAPLEDIAMWLALILTTLAAVVAVVASARFWGGAVLPFGVLIYFALPPARDFATSGLEWGLSLAWIAIWWALLVGWAQPGGKRASFPVGYWLAFWSGLSWLVRPELALYGGLTGIVLIAYAWKQPKEIAGILAFALPVPAAYQIFRMGYYGLLTPHTAVAKSASDSEWAAGFGYAWDLLQPYALYLPLLVAIGVAVWLGVSRQGRDRTIMILVYAVAWIHVLYVLRVGGDFMHGRMWLLPLFAMLLPLMAIPLNRVTVAVVAAVAVWSTVVIVRAHPIDWEVYETEPLNIVDEREFWSNATYREQGQPPRYASDFLTSKNLGPDWHGRLALAQEENAGQLAQIILSAEPEMYSWITVPRTQAETDLQGLDPTLYLINLGMTSMNADLDIRVLDTVGLATPLAARMPRDPEGRIGHDKHLDLAWQAADSATDLDQLPEWYDKKEAKQARAALRTPEIAELMASYREPMNPRRFLKNIKFSLTAGRTLELDEDPAKYLDTATLEAIENGMDPGLTGQQIAWLAP